MSAITTWSAWTQVRTACSAPQGHDSDQPGHSCYEKGEGKTIFSRQPLLPSVCCCSWLVLIHVCVYKICFTNGRDSRKVGSHSAPLSTGETPARALSDVTTPFLLLRNIKQQQSVIYMNVIMHRKPMDAPLLPNSFLRLLVRAPAPPRAGFVQQQSALHPARSSGRSLLPLFSETGWQPLDV